MKLFVVGSNSGNPDDWEWGGQTIVLAENEDKARALVGDNHSQVAEVSLSEAKIIFTIPPYGDD